MFLAQDLGLETKRLIYQSVVLGVLLHGAESWAPTQMTLEIFHCRCVRSITGIGKAVQWAQHISTVQLPDTSV